MTKSILKRHFMPETFILTDNNLQRRVRLHNIDILSHDTAFWNLHFYTPKVRDRAKFIGGMGPVWKAMGQTFFYRFKAWGGHFFRSLRPWGGYFFSLSWSQGEDIYRRKCSWSYIFHWNSRRSLKRSCTYRSVLKQFWHRAQPLKRILWAVTFFEDSTYERIRFTAI